MPKVNKTKRNRYGGIQKKPTSNQISPLTKELSNKSSSAQIHNTTGNNTSTKTTTTTNTSTSTSKNTTITNENKNPPSKDNLSRNQLKKRNKKLQYLKRQNMILATLSLKQKDEQKKRIDGLDALKEALKGVEGTLSKSNDNPSDDTHHDNTNTNTNTNDKKDKSKLMTTNKAKKDLAVKEIHHMNLVLQHPSFQQNPFATIQEHLKNTLSDQAKQQQIRYAQLKKDAKKKEDAIRKQKQNETKTGMMKHSKRKQGNGSSISNSNTSTTWGSRKKKRR